MLLSCLSTLDVCLPCIAIYHTLHFVSLMAATLLNCRSKGGNTNNCDQRYEEYKGVMPSEQEYMLLCSTVSFNPVSFNTSRSADSAFSLCCSKCQTLFLHTFTRQGHSEYTHQHHHLQQLHCSTVPASLPARFMKLDQLHCHFYSHLTTPAILQKCASIFTKDFLMMSPFGEYTPT